MIVWQEIKQSEGVSFWRAKVPGGWLLRWGNSAQASLCFLPDPDHQWDGSSPP